MASETISLLQNLVAGSELRLFVDAGAVQFTKTALYIAAAACFLFTIKLFAAQLGLFGSTRSIIGVIGVIATGVIAFLLYDKAQSYQVLDTHDPVIIISAQRLEYDVKLSGWGVNWADIAEVQLHKETHQQKQSVAQTTYEVRVTMKQGASVQWKYEADGQNKIAADKKLYEEKSYLVMDPAPLGIDPETLQKALERYRAGR